MTNNLYIILLAAGSAGAIIGSFVNMLIHRLINDEDIIWKRSYCTHCKQTLAIRSLIPIFSYLKQRGTCNLCNSRISPRYLIVELLYTGLALAYLIPSSPLYLAHQFTLFSALVILLFFTDLEQYYLPLSVTTLLVITGLISAFFSATLVSHLKAGLLISMSLLLFRAICNRIYPKDSLGLGDIILLFGFACHWGLINTLETLYCSIILGGFTSLYLILVGKKERSDHIAFGPFIILSFYINHFFHPLSILINL